MSQLSIPTQVKVATGFWNLISVERRPFAVVGVRYVPRYRHTWWDHSSYPAGERQP